MSAATDAQVTIDGLERALLALDRVTFQRLFHETDATLSPVARVEQLIVPVLERIGAGWEEGSVSLAQVYMSGRICEEMVDVVLPPTDSSRTDQPPMAIAVLEDYHFLGKRLVYSALRASGYSLLNYSRCETDELVQRVIADNIRILLISTLMLPSALRVRDVRAGLQAAGHEVTIIVGGAPFRFDDQLWREVGADATGASAGDAVRLLEQLVRAPS
jgi:methanogenic corrinoid protein MtbC1